MTPTRILHTFVALACLPSLLCTAQDVKFESIAPKGSMVVLRAKDLNATAVRMENSPVAQLMNAPEIAAITAQNREKAAKERAEQLREMGVDVDEVPWPGPVGVALFTERNEETDSFDLGILIWADYGSRADVAEKVLEAIIKDMEKKSGKSFEQVEIAGGLKAKRIMLEDAEDDTDPQDPQPPGRRRPRGVDAFGEITQVPESIFYVRVGSQFFAASSVSTLEDAIAAASGKPMPCVADTEDWRGISSVIGDQEISAVLLTEPIQALLAPVFAGPMASGPVMMKELFGDIRGWAFTMAAESDAATVEVGVCAYVPGAKVGLIDLLSDSTPITDPPIILGDDAVSYQRINVRFGNIMSMIENFLASLPDAEADAIAPMIQQFGPGMTKAFSAIGPEVSTVSRPVPGDELGMRTFTAVACSDEKAANALLATMLPSMGMMPRDFQGQIVYGSEDLGMAIGLGGGALLMGSAAEVEQSLRASADASTTTLGANAMYRQALAAVGQGSVVGWGYADMATLMEDYRKEMLTKDEDEGDADDADDDSGLPGKESLGVLVPSLFDPSMVSVREVMEKVDQAMIARYIGPLVWDIRSDAKTLKVRALWLRPAVQPTAK